MSHSWVVWGKIGFAERCCLLLAIVFSVYGNTVSNNDGGKFSPEILHFGAAIGQNFM